MEYFSTFPVYGYYLDTLVLDTCLVEGENVVAIHVLNDSLNGSDLFFLLQLYNLTNAYYNLYTSAFRCKRQYFIDSVNFPLVMIETDGYGIPYKNIRVDAFMGIVDNGPGAYNKPGDLCNVYYGDVSIEVRGQSSSEFPKRSYRFEMLSFWECLQMMIGYCSDLFRIRLNSVILWYLIWPGISESTSPEPVIVK